MCTIHSCATCKKRIDNNEKIKNYTRLILILIDITGSYFCYFFYLNDLIKVIIYHPSPFSPNIKTVKNRIEVSNLALKQKIKHDQTNQNMTK